MSDGSIVRYSVAIISAAARNNVPAVYPRSEIARDGGLLSYGVDLVDIVRRAAVYVDRILRGAKPGDLPVQLPTKYEMVLNLNRQGAWPDNPSDPASHRRRSDRISRFVAAVHITVPGPSRYFDCATEVGRYRGRADS